MCHITSHVLFTALYTSGRRYQLVPPLPQYVFMAWCLLKHRDNCTCTCRPIAVGMVRFGTHCAGLWWSSAVCSRRLGWVAPHILQLDLQGLPAPLRGLRLGSPPRRSSNPVPTSGTCCMPSLPCSTSASWLFCRSNLIQVSSSQWDLTRKYSWISENDLSSIIYEVCFYWIPFVQIERNMTLF